MYVEPKSPYAQTLDYGSTSNVELSSLPPTALQQPRTSPVDDTFNLLTRTNTANDSIINKRSSKHSQDSANEKLDSSTQKRFRKYFRLKKTLSSADGDNAKFRGWRKAVVFAAIATGIILFINLCFAALASVKYPPTDGVGTLYTGDCDFVEGWDTASHLLINLLATSLLAASNFTMQCICSPTRSDVDKAHAKRIYLEIGLPSVRNLSHTKFWKVVLWVLLCLSALPLHLLWNSVVFSTKGTHLWTYVIAEESFLSGDIYLEPFQSGFPNFTSCRGRIWDDTDANAMLANIYNGYKAQNYTRLTTEQCFNAYNAEYLNNRRNLIMVTKPNATTRMSDCGYSNQQWNGSSIIAVDFDLPGGWSYILGGDTGALSLYKQQVDSTGTWDFGTYPIEYCYSETNVASECKLQYASFLIYITVACNVVKLVCMCVAARCLWNLNEPILATVGDATAAFLERPDPATKGFCLLDLHTLQKGTWRLDATQSRGHEYDSTYDRKKKTRLYYATSSKRWWSSMLPYIIYLILGFLLFDLSFHMTPYTRAQVMRLSFGQVDAQMIMNLKGSSGVSLIIDVLVANSFQLALSTTYFLLNSLYTAQYSALEWASYSQGKHKSLRVTWPHGQQKSTYYLELPWRYSIPLIAFSILMHFLLSQSIFLARLLYYDSLGDLSDFGFTDVGFSPKAILTSCCVGLGIVLAQILHACRPLDNHMPIHGNKSVIISAICHAEASSSTELDKHSSGVQECTSIAEKPLIWGVVGNPSPLCKPTFSDAKVAQSLVGHCAFSAKVVELPQVGKQYR